MIFTDEELARWSVGLLPLPEGEHECPAAVLVISGRRHRLTMRQALSPQAAFIAPELAATFEAVAPAPLASLPLGERGKLASLAVDYSPAEAVEGSVPAPVYSARLATCSRCLLWRLHEAGHFGHCDHVDCRCSRRLLWPDAESCPDGKW